MMRKGGDIEAGLATDNVSLQEAQVAKSSTSWREQGIALGCCFVGLQASYLTWGVMQELIMDTQFEATPLVPTGKFPSPTFCVFSNRIIAIIVAMALCFWKHGTVKSSAPLWMLMPCSLSNTMSSFCQYASLAYVPFPLQNLFKSTKVIPVMLMGRFLKGTSYPWVQYMEAAAITMGVYIFSQTSSKASTGNAAAASTDTAAALESVMESPFHWFGVMLLCGYVLSDSFTSQWQSKVYSDYGKIDQYHMMFGVNLWSILLTVMSLIMAGEVPVVVEFLTANPKAAYYNIITGVVSTTGQLFIFYTIKRFGPVVLTIIMTTRQMFSMVISCLLFGHALSSASLVGAVVVFGAVLFSITRQYEEKRLKAGKPS